VTLSPLASYVIQRGRDSLQKALFQKLQRFLFSTGEGRRNSLPFVNYPIRKKLSFLFLDLIRPLPSRLSPFPVLKSANPFFPVESTPSPLAAPVASGSPLFLCICDKVWCVPLFSPVQSVGFTLASPPPFAHPSVLPFLVTTNRSLNFFPLLTQYAKTPVRWRSHIEAFVLVS